jgi:hypothetical protein
MNDDRLMTDDKLLRWLVEFGTDWVTKRTILGSWADN